MGDSTQFFTITAQSKAITPFFAGSQSSLALLALSSPLIANVLRRRIHRTYSEGRGSDQRYRLRLANIRPCTCTHTLRDVPPGPITWCVTRRGSTSHGAGVCVFTAALGTIAFCLTNLFNESVNAFTKTSIGRVIGINPPTSTPPNPKLHSLHSLITANFLKN